MGPSCHFYSFIGLIKGDTGIPRVDGLSTRHPEIWGVTLSELASIQNFWLLWQAISQQSTQL